MWKCIKPRTLSNPVLFVWLSITNLFMVVFKQTPNQQLLSWHQSFAMRNFISNLSRSLVCLPTSYCTMLIVLRTLSKRRTTCKEVANHIRLPSSGSTKQKNCNANFEIKCQTLCSTWNLQPEVLQIPSLKVNSCRMHPRKYVEIWTTLNLFYIKCASQISFLSTQVSIWLHFQLRCQRSV